MKFHELRRIADRVRAIPLEAVLLRSEAERDRHDRAKWRTREGVLSVTGVRFMDWKRGRGGGGAIDLAMHVHGLDFKAAVAWLERSFPDPGEYGTDRIRDVGRDLRLPAADVGALTRVRRYLVRERGLPLSLLEPLIGTGRLYADAKANAVFLLLGEGKRAVGAELRGTGPCRWRGMAPGSRKDLGYFSVAAAGGREGGEVDEGGDPGADTEPAADVVLCESAIDALSCRMLKPERVCISTSGARANPGWLGAFLQRGHAVWCGFDADLTGDEMAEAMRALHPTVRRLRPALHDWNDVIRLQP